MSQDLTAVWGDVAARVDALYASGRGHLLTEDVLRWATIDALEAAGIGADLLAAEQIIPSTRGKIDLVVLGPNPTAIEFKFPRDARGGVSPDTMTWGELLKDICRLAHLREFGDRWAVMLLNDRLCGYLARRSGCILRFEPGDQIRLTPEELSRLPATAGGSLRDYVQATTTATCVTCDSVSGHRLVTYRVEPSWTV